MECVQRENKHTYRRQGTMKRSILIRGRIYSLSSMGPIVCKSANSSATGDNGKSLTQPLFFLACPPIKKFNGRIKPFNTSTDLCVHGCTFVRYVRWICMISCAMDRVEDLKIMAGVCFEFECFCDQSFVFEIVYILKLWENPIVISERFLLYQTEIVIRFC